MRYLVFLILMVGCQYEPYEYRCIQSEYINEMICPEIYEPVCTPDGTTYMNYCYALKDGWEERCVIEGECE